MEAKTTGFEANQSKAKKIIPNRKEIPKDNNKEC